MIVTSFCCFGVVSFISIMYLKRCGNTWNDGLGGKMYVCVCAVYDAMIDWVVLASSSFCSNIMPNLSINSLPPW